MTSMISLRRLTPTQARRQELDERFEESKGKLQSGDDLRLEC